MREMILLHLNYKNMFHYKNYIKLCINLSEIIKYKKKYKNLKISGYINNKFCMRISY